MFSLNQQIKLKQAKNALRDGRLDEAYTILSDGEIREYHDGQVLLEKLVSPLLNRAEKHLEESRLQNALTDVERALEVGGNRPHTAKLRQEVRDAIKTREKDLREGHALLEAAQGHLDNGSLHAGKQLLENAPLDKTGVPQLKRLADYREQKGKEAQRRAELFLKQGEIEEALLATREATEAHGREPSLPDLLIRLKKEANKKMDHALLSGDLKLASRLSACLSPLFGNHLELRGFEDILSLAHKAAHALKQGDFESARVALGRLQGLHPKFSWIRKSMEDLDSIAGSLRSLNTGPLGLLNSLNGSKNSLTSASTKATIVMSCENQKQPDKNPPPLTNSRLLLWIDGVGSFLVLTSERNSIGRAGSSALPSIALPADLSGHHAEILRVEDDYFMVSAQGEVMINGNEKISRKLLANGDKLDLGQNCRIMFHLPTALSSTAVLSLHKGLRIEKDVRKIILLDRDLILGSHGNCHVQAPVNGHPVVISLRKGGLYCRTQQEISIDGHIADNSADNASLEDPKNFEAPIPIGAHIQVGDLSFTITTPRLEAH